MPRRGPEAGSPHKLHGLMIFNRDRSRISADRLGILTQRDRIPRAGPGPGPVHRAWKFPMISVNVRSCSFQRSAWRSECGLPTSAPVPLRQPAFDACLFHQAGKEITGEIYRSSGIMIENFRAAYVHSRAGKVREYLTGTVFP